MFLVWIIFFIEYDNCLYWVNFKIVYKWLIDREINEVLIVCVVGLSFGCYFVIWWVRCVMYYDKVVVYYD